MPRLSFDVTQQQDLDAIYAYTLAAWGAGQAKPISRRQSMAVKPLTRLH